MSNAASSKQHGGHKINERRTKSKMGKRRNKAKAGIRRAALKAKGLNC